MATETPAEKKEREEREAAEAQAKADAEAKAQEEPRHDAEYLVRNCVSLLGSRRTLVAAALSLSDRKTHTVAQAKDLLAKLEKVRTDPYEGAAEVPAEVEV